jgi:hypothetical protein
MKPTLLIACAGIVLVTGTTICRADFLEVTRPATLRAEPTRDSNGLGVMAEGTALPLIDDSATSGYYHVRWESSNTEGWVYRTFVKRNSGSAPESASTLNPNETDISFADELSWGHASKTTSCLTRNGLPDGACTPGDIIQDEDESVICSPEFKTGTVRDQTTSRTEKRTVYPAYGIPFPPAGQTQGKTQVCEIDHLVPLQLGGADTLANLWPECSAGYANWGGPGFRDKDGFENYLWFRVCKKKDVTLHDAQIGIASDWRTEWEKAGKPVCHNRQNCK